MTVSRSLAQWVQDGHMSVSEEEAMRREHAAVVSQDFIEDLPLALEVGGIGVWRWDKATDRTQWDAMQDRLFGIAPGSFDGTFDSWVALIHPADVDAILRAFASAQSDPRPFSFEHRVTWPDASVHWLHCKGTMTHDEGGEISGAIGLTYDVTGQTEVRLERQRVTKFALEAAQQEREGKERLEFLGRINDALADSYTVDQVMRNVTRSAVPRMGDWCMLFVLTEDSPLIPIVEIAHADPEMVEYARELRDRFPYDPDQQIWTPHVIRTGQSEFYPNITDEDIDTLPEEPREILRILGVRSAMSVPLRKHNRIIGAMQFVNTVGSRAFTDDDLALARATASRVASSLENVRLSERQRTIAQTLQASLLPDSLPDVPGVDIGVRYWAAGEGTEVGGDFYDVFEVEGGHAVVIGDVCGTGPLAASMTSLARHTIRAAAWQGADHVEVLRQLNNAMLRSGRSTFCTVAYATVARHDGRCRFEFACAGHPLPILHREGEAAHPIGEPGTLLGAFPDTHSTVTTVELEPGDTIVLHTDGATDVRPPFGLTSEDFREIVEDSSAASASADDVVERIGARLSEVLEVGNRNDDIALLALRMRAAAARG